MVNHRPAKPPTAGLKISWSPLQDAKPERDRIAVAKAIRNNETEKMDHAHFAANPETVKDQNILSQRKVIKSNATGFLDFDINGLRTARRKQDIDLNFRLFNPSLLVNPRFKPDILKVNRLAENRNNFHLSISGITFHAKHNLQRRIYWRTFFLEKVGTTFC
jgi:hypothetical protein